MQNQLDPFIFAVHKPGMRKFIVILSYIGCVSGVIHFDFAHAQTQQSEEIQTPRDRIVHDLGLHGLLTSDASENAAISLTKRQSSAPLAPFYLSAQAYLQLRDMQTQPQTILYYDVRRGPVSAINFTSVLDKVQKVQITLGEDFAAVKFDGKLKIYDFKFNRLLTIRPEDKKSGGEKSGGEKLGEKRPEYSQKTAKSDKPVFDNISLYAKAYRNMSTVKRVTRNGSLKILPMGKGQSLDAFWIESSMSWAASAPDTPLNIEQKPQSLSVKRKKQLVFKAKFSDVEYGSSAFRDTLLAFAHHEWPLHPQILQALYGYNAPPKQFEMLTYSPTALKGQKQTWVLTKQTQKQAVFPLPEKALGGAQRQDVSPLAFIINEAAHNRALGGIKTLDALEQRFTQQLEAGEIWQAWLTGQRYAAYSGMCDSARDSTICQSLRDIEAQHMSTQPEPIQDYFTSLRAAQRPGLKAEAIKVVLPYLSEKNTPAFVLRTAAMARAKMKPKQAKDAGLSEINAETLLKTALAKDPYDPKTYVGLAQVLAAKGVFEQSWDIYDALRTAIPTTNAVELRINRVEKNLRKSTPGYFLDQ